MGIQTFRDLMVWRKSMELVTRVYQATKTFPKEEIYGLTSQVRRSAVSVPSNIAEGYGRFSRAEYLRFLQIANGSLCEMQTQLEISVNLGYLSKEGFSDIYEQSREIERMLSSLTKKLSPCT
jgi:four helix bundle protein